MFIHFSGLGTSTSKEAKEYFAEMEKHRITFRYSGAEDDAAITLVSYSVFGAGFSEFHCSLAI